MASAVISFIPSRHTLREVQLVTRYAIFLPLRTVKGPANLGAKFLFDCTVLKFLALSLIPDLRHWGLLCVFACAPVASCRFCARPAHISGEPCIRRRDCC